MKTISNTENICFKAYHRMWIVRRLKELGCETGELLDVLRQQVLSVAEQAVPFLGPIITKQERILKAGLHIIYQQDYVSFYHVLKISKMKSLALRRKDIISKFCRQAEKSDTYSNWFCQLDRQNITRDT